MEVDPGQCKGMISQIMSPALRMTAMLLMDNAITADQLAALNDQLRRWVDESRQHVSNFGEIMDGRPRFDVEPRTHSPETPRAAPHFLANRGVRHLSGRNP